MILYDLIGIGGWYCSFDFEDVIKVMAFSLRFASKVIRGFGVMILLGDEIPDIFPIIVSRVGVIYLLYCQGPHLVLLY